jgi:hypothetical protein
VTAVARARRSALPDAAERRAAAVIAGVVLAFAALVAAAVAAFAAGDVRDALGFGFASVPRTLREAVTIFVSNARLMGVVGATTLIVQSAWIAAWGEALGRGSRILRAVADVWLVAAVAFNVAVVGAAVGAYGVRMVVAMLPHGPPELAAYALGLTLYVRARRELLPVAVIARLAAWALGLLAVSAFLETFLHL